MTDNPTAANWQSTPVFVPVVLAELKGKGLIYLSLIALNGETTVFKDAGLVYTLGTSFYDVVRFDQISESEWARLMVAAAQRKGIRSYIKDNNWQSGCRLNGSLFQAYGDSPTEAIARCLVASQLDGMQLRVPQALLA